MTAPRRPSATAIASKRRIRRRRCRRGLPGRPLPGTVQSRSPGSRAGAPQYGQLPADTPAGVASRDGAGVLMATPTNRELQPLRGRLPGARPVIQRFQHLPPEVGARVEEVVRSTLQQHRGLLAFLRQLFPNSARGGCKGSSQARQPWSRAVPSRHG